MRFATSIVMSIAVLTAACGGGDTASAGVEFQRAKSGDMDVVLLSNDGALSHDKDTFTVEFRRGDTLVDVGTVKGAAMMPMAGMAPMLGSVFIERGDTPGRYTAETDLSMSGGWNLKIEWNGATGKGSATFNATVE